MARQLRRGSKVGKYLLEKKLGQGAFAVVWKARDTVEKRRVALKVALPESLEAFDRDALEQEARIAARLAHPNIVAVRNADWINGHFVIATDLAEKNLSHYPGARRSTRIALRVVSDVVAGLAYAHGKGILHRDVKPENILIFADGHAALGDFGSSRPAKGATRVFTEAGTLGYMAPEQAFGRPRYASDVFSVGLITYELLTGSAPTWPFEWPLPGDERFRRRLPEPLRPVFKKALAFNPKGRWPDAVALEAALERALAKAEQSRERPAPRRRKKPAAPAPSPLAVQSDLFRRRHGALLGMRYACHRCGGSIAESMPHCPWCGTSDNSFRDISSYPLVCPECEHGVLPEWTSCPWCYAGRLEGNGRAPRADSKSERNCSRKGCSGQLRAFMRYCPVCKQKPRRLWSHAELPERCPRCRWPVSRAYWRFCAWCGRREPSAGSFVRSSR